MAVAVTVAAAVVVSVQVLVVGVVGVQLHPICRSSTAHCIGVTVVVSRTGYESGTKCHGTKTARKYISIVRIKDEANSFVPCSSHAPCGPPLYEMGTIDMVRT